MRLRYTYKVSRGAASYKGEEVQVGNGGWSSSTTRDIYDRHGIRLVFTVSGKVGRFDFQNFILRECTNSFIPICSRNLLIRHMIVYADDRVYDIHGLDCLRGGVRRQICAVRLASLGTVKP